MIFTLLAQTDRAKELADNVAHTEPTSMPSFSGDSVERYKDWVQNIRDTALPMPEETIGSLQGFGMFQMVVFCALGAAFLILGWKWFRFLVPFTMAQLGAVISASLAIGFGLSPWWWLVALALGFLITLLLAIKLIQGFIVLFVMLVGAGVGAMAGYHVCQSLGQTDAFLVFTGIGAGIGVILLTFPVFVFFRVTMMAATSLLGAVNLVTGGLAIALNYEQSYHPVVRYMTDWPISPLIAVLAVAGLGFTIQLAWWFREKEAQSSDDNDRGWGDETRPRMDQNY